VNPGYGEKIPLSFQVTRDPKVLIQAAVDFAASDQLSDHGVLVAQLNSNAFLSGAAQHPERIRHAQY